MGCFVTIGVTKCRKTTVSWN